MPREILIESFLGQKRMAVLEDGRIAEYSVEQTDTRNITGNIYVGRVRDILSGIHAAFVDIGLEKNGFLSMDDIAVSRGEMTDELKAELARRGTVLHRGDTVTVQVSKETAGEKGPRVTGNITLPGQLLVLLPTLSYVSVSRKITDKGRRDQLRKLAFSIRRDGMGMILRTASQDADESAVAEEYERLAALWESIVQRARYAPVPSRLYGDAEPETRAARDLLTAKDAVLITNDPAVYGNVCAAAPKEKAVLRENAWLFDERKLDAKLRKAFARRVELPGGGNIVVDYTEALTVIDVNSSSFTGKNDLAETARSTNLEAAREAARQIRLRDISGIVLIDFIDMASPEDQKLVSDELERTVAQDRIPVSLHGFTKAGLFELTRKKTGKSAFRMGSTECPHCGGTGWTESVETAAVNALRELTIRTQKEENGLFLVSAASELAPVLLETGRDFKGNAFVYTDKTRAGSQYAISPAFAEEIPRTAKALGKGN